MKVYSVRCLFIDHDGEGPDGCREMIANVRTIGQTWPSHIEVDDGVEIGDWYDGHPLNQGGVDGHEWLKNAETHRRNLERTARAKLAGAGLTDGELAALGLYE